MNKNGNDDVKSSEPLLLPQNQVSSNQSYPIQNGNQITSTNLLPQQNSSSSNNVTETDDKKKKKKVTAPPVNNKKKSGSAKP